MTAQCNSQQSLENCSQLKVLMVGNSFTQSVLKYLPDLAAQDAPGRLLIVNTYIGGCSFQRHIEEISLCDADPDYRPYATNYQDWGYTSLKSILPAEKWDIVTIQQASPLSWRAETYEPYATKLITLIRQLAPQAEIVIQQTWTYRADAPNYALYYPEWGVDQTTMYEKLTENYRNLAEKNSFRIIPTGKAVQLTRKRESYPFKLYDRDSLASYRWPDLPAQSGDVVGSLYWRKNSETGELEIGLDSTHFNQRGQYLQSCVWFGFLFPELRDKITFVPDIIANSDAKLLQSCALDSLKELYP